MNYKEHVAYDQGALAAANKEVRIPRKCRSIWEMQAWLNGYDQETEYQNRQLELFHEKETKAAEGVCPEPERSGSYRSASRGPG